MKTSNARKYESAEQNPVVGHLLNRFFEAIDDLWPQDVKKVLDVGCGEGHALHRLEARLPNDVWGIDHNQAVISVCHQRFPDFAFQAENIYDLPFEDQAFDLLLCLEVLEHLENPDQAIRQLERVTSQWAILSVPHEPWFRLGNFCRGKYLATLGNHPEHIQHWGPRSFRRFIADETDFEIERLATPFPWVLALCKRH